MQRIDLFIEDPFNPELNNHKLHGEFESDLFSWYFGYRKFFLFYPFTQNILQTQGTKPFSIIFLKTTPRIFLTFSSNRFHESSLKSPTLLRNEKTKKLHNFPFMILYPPHMKQDSIYWLKKLIEIESISEQEKEITDYLENLLQDTPGGMFREKNTVVWKSPNWSKKKESIAFFCHTDTVPFNAAKWKITHPTTPLEKDGKIYGRGSCDMKCGGAIMLELLFENAKNNFKNWNYNVSMIFYDKEELGTPNGITDLLEKNLLPEIDLAIIPEPTDGKINFGVFTSFDFEIHAHGKAIHSSKSYKGENAIYKLIPLLEAFKNFPRKKIYETEEAVSVNTIEGGIAMNTVPDFAKFFVDYRVDPSLDVEQILDSFPNLGDTELKILGFYKGYIAEKENPVLQKLIQTSGKNDEFIAAFWSDIAQLGNHGIPAINFGPGNINIAHTVDEFVEIEKVQKVHKTLQKFLESTKISCS